MIKIDVIKKICKIEDDTVFSFKLDRIDGPEVACELFRKGYVRVVNLEQENVVNIIPANNTDMVGVCIVDNIMVDDGDYDIEDNYIPYYVEEENFTRIYFCPITGEKYEINIIKEIDITKDYIELEEKIKKAYKGRYKNKKNRAEYEGLINAQYELLQDVFTPC